VTAGAGVWHLCWSAGLLADSCKEKRCQQQHHQSDSGRQTTATVLTVMIWHMARTRCRTAAAASATPSAPQPLPHSSMFQFLRVGLHCTSCADALAAFGGCWAVLSISVSIQGWWGGSAPVPQQQHIDAAQLCCSVRYHRDAVLLCCCRMLPNFLHTTRFCVSRAGHH
jgi:hypothetical protein